MANNGSDSQIAEESKQTLSRHLKAHSGECVWSVKTAPGVSEYYGGAGVFLENLSSSCWLDLSATARSCTTWMVTDIPLRSAISHAHSGIKSDISPQMWVLLS